MDIPEDLMSILISAAEIAFTSYDLSVQAFFSKDESSTNEIIDKEEEIEELFKKSHLYHFLAKKLLLYFI